MLVPLFDKDLYDKLAVLRAEMGSAGVSNIAHVFVPVGVSLSDARAGAPRILCVGRATRRFDEEWLGSYEGASETGKQVLLAGLSGKRDTGERWYSPYWSFNRAVACGVVERSELGACKISLADYCGWSNLAKIGGTKSNLGQESLAIQAKICIAAIRAEIVAFKPTAIVLTTGDYAMNDIVFPVFGNKEWSWMTPQDDLLSWKFDAATGALVVWTNHPQRMGERGSYARVRDFTVELIVSAAGGGPMPPSEEPKRNA